MLFRILFLMLVLSFSANTLADELICAGPITSGGHVELFTDDM